MIRLSLTYIEMAGSRVDFSLTHVFSCFSTNCVNFVVYCGEVCVALLTCSCVKCCSSFSVSFKSFIALSVVLLVLTWYYQVGHPPGLPRKVGKFESDQEKGPGICGYGSYHVLCD